MPENEAQQFCLLFNAEADVAGWPMRCDAVCNFAEKKLENLYDLWRGKADGGVPSRAKLDMRTLRPYARNIAIMERVEKPGGHSYRFRLFGSELALIFGEHTGHLLDEMVLPSVLPGWVAFYDMVLATRAPLSLVNFFRKEATGFLKGELFAAPLCDNTGDIRFVLVATFVDLNSFAHPPFAQAGPLSA